MSTPPGSSPRTRSLALLIVLGGVAVLTSYVWGLSAYPELRAGLWGGVPDALRPVYTINMFLAAAGFFPFTAYILLALDPARTRIGRADYRLFHAAYFAILLPSALWLPLTLAMLQAPSPALWLAIRVDLLLVAVGTLLCALGVARARPVTHPRLRRGALVGLGFFALQTVVLDALLWPATWPG